MLNWLLCTLIGHRFILKAYTTVNHDVKNAITEQPGMFYMWEQQKYCVRCGKPNPYFLMVERSSGKPQ